MALNLKYLSWSGGDIKGITAFTTPRNCNNSASASDPYSSFNVCHYVGDTPEHLAMCRELLCQHLDISNQQLVIPRQTHTANVAIITHENSCQDFTDVDALVTKLPNVAIGINTADCVPILLADPSAGVIAAVHAGWRGTVAGIAANAINAMTNIGATPGNIQAIIAPHICPGCFEVGEEVVAQFATHGFPVEKIRSINPVTGKSHINLAAANTWVMQQCGIPSQAINNCQICSHCDCYSLTATTAPDNLSLNHMWFSARTLGIASGRTFTAIIRQ